MGCGSDYDPVIGRVSKAGGGTAHGPGVVVTDFLAALDARDIPTACASVAPGVTVTALGQTYAGRDAVAGALAGAGEVFYDSRVVTRATDVTRDQVRADMIVAVRSATSANAEWVVASGYLTAAVAGGVIETLAVTLDSDAMRAQLAGTAMAAGSLRSELALIGFDPNVRPETDVRVIDVPKVKAATGPGRRRGAAVGVAAALLALGAVTAGLVLTASDEAPAAAPTATAPSGVSEDAVSPSPAPVESSPEPQPAATTLLGPQATERADGSITTALSGTVLFERDSAVLRPDARNTVGDLAASLSRAQGGTLELVGYTDNLGSAARGRELSAQRARAVAAIFRDRLAGTGIKVSATGRGEADPVAPNDSEANRAKNRRVEVIYTP